MVQISYVIYTSNLPLFFFCNFPPSFRWFSSFPDGIFLGRHLRHLFVMRFIKSTFTCDNRNHVHSPHIYSHFQRASPQGLAKNRKGQWWQKGIYSCPSKVIFDASLCILCTAFLQKLYCASVSHGMAQIVLKMADLSILMEPTLLLAKGSATVFYNAFGRCWYLNVACMLAA